ncbi:MASE1 domain-containing protein [Streptomyces sp. NPDC048566]|uniref:MASE1 domain-containing protein n=1 Tax=Streptomyces sp. NPDC048566 TaxID=3365569 RepID=UPI0037159037
MARVVGTHELRRPAVLALQTLAITACYFGAGRLGLVRQLSVDGAVFTPIWPPTGVAVAALLLLGMWAWPGIALGAFLVVLSISSFSSITPSVAGIVAGNTIAPVCAYLLLRAVGFRNDLGRLRDGLALVFLAALGSMAISATSAVGLLIATDKLAAGGFWPVWLAWWVGDAVGVLIVTPVILMAYTLRTTLRPSRWKEAVLLLVAVAVVVPYATRSNLSVLYLVYPLLIWAALRFELVGSMVCALFASVMATVAATDGSGAFANLSDTSVMIKLQAFNGSMALTALLLSAVITEQRNTRRSVEQACQELVQVLEHLTAGNPPPPPRSPPPPPEDDPLR